MPTSQIIQQLYRGDLASKLAGFPPELTVRFDGHGDYPDDLMSYRGYYEQLSVGYGPRPVWTVGDMVSRLRGAVGKEFTGYKGGEFQMDELTPLWMSNYGEARSTAIVGVIRVGDEVVIRTAEIDN